MYQRLSGLEGNTDLHQRQALVEQQERPPSLRALPLHPAQGLRRCLGQGQRLGADLQEQFGQPVVVENRPGASGNIGARVVAESPPDGYTLLMVNSSFAINPGVYRSLGFSPRRDFTAVMNVAFVPSVFVVPAASPLRTLDDALNAARLERPLPFASCGNGTPQHLAGEMLARATGAPFEAKDKLKARGYRWDGEGRVWWCSLSSDDLLDAECAWLRAEVYGQRSARVQLEAMDSQVQFSSRSGIVSEKPL